jgi:hypothetical protein
MRRVLTPLAAALFVLTAVPFTAAAGDTPKGKTVRGDDDKKGEKKAAGEKGEQRGEQKGKDEDEGKGRKLPKAVAEAVKSVFPGMKVMKSEAEDEDGEVVYAVTLRGKRGTLEAKLTPKGRVVEVELKGDDDEDEGKHARKGKKDNEKAKGKEKDDERGEKGKEKGKEKEDDQEKNKGKKKDKDD